MKRKGDVGVGEKLGFPLSQMENEFPPPVACLVCECVCAEKKGGGE